MTDRSRSGGIIRCVGSSVQSVDRFRVASLNLSWQTSDRQRALQPAALHGFDLAMLQEVRTVDLERFCDEFDWCIHSLTEGAEPGVLGVAILGRNGTVHGETHQLTAADFVNDDLGDRYHVDDDLARRFHQRHLAVDVQLESGRPLRVASLHATPGTSDAPGPRPRRRVGNRKQWFHTRIARWLAEWEMPFLFAIDANTPRVDVLDWGDVEFHRPCVGPARPGEDFLLGPPGTRLHGADDLWRVWLESADGTADRAAVPDGGPLRGRTPPAEVAGSGTTISTRPPTSCPRRWPTKRRTPTPSAQYRIMRW